MTLLIPLYYAYSGLIIFAALLFAAVAWMGSPRRWLYWYFAGLCLIAGLFMIDLAQVSISREVADVFLYYRWVNRWADLFFLLYPGFVLLYCQAKNRGCLALIIAWLIFFGLRESEWRQPGLIDHLQLILIDYPWGEKVAWLGGLPPELPTLRALLAIISSTTGLSLGIRALFTDQKPQNLGFSAAALLLFCGQLWDQALSTGLVNGLYLGEHTFMGFIVVMSLDLMIEIHRGIVAQSRLRRLSMEMALTEQRHRQRLAEALHDGPLQLLSMAALRLESGNHEKAVRDLLQRANQSIRSVVFRLNPPVLDKFGLKSALAQLAETTAQEYDIHCRLVWTEQISELSRDAQIILYQCIEELIRNAIKHAACSRIHIICRRQGHHWVLAVEDDGKGFDPDSCLADQGASNGFGLFSLEQRLTPLKGVLDVRSSQAGTRVEIQLPCSQG